MKTVLPLFIMIDACGWEIVKNKSFLDKAAPRRKKLESVFGYSSACVPSILSGRWPEEHRNWCYFVYDPANSPFRALKALRFVPKALTSRRIVRRLLTRLVRARLGFKGYFDLYNIPFDQISWFDFSEKKSPLQPGGLNCGPNIFDVLQAEGVSYSSSDPLQSEETNIAALEFAIQTGSIDFAFSYWPNLDGVLHRVGNDSPEIDGQLWSYQRSIERLVGLAKKHYGEVLLYVFSDHGMANCDELLDLRTQIEALGLTIGNDYVVVYDSTMARFWFRNPHARNKVSACLEMVPQGRIISDTELKALKTFFPDRRFGELIFLVREGVLIVPSHMGERPLRAMHGYHPSEKHSYATLFSNTELPEHVTAIPHIFNLMVESARCAKSINKRESEAIVE